MVSTLKSSIFSILLLYGCSGDAVEWVDWPIPPGARNIQSYDLNNDNAHQISFNVNAGYPNKLVAEFYSEQVKSPWVRCYQKMEWQYFGDVTQTPPAFIHQMLLHWADFENNRLLLLGVRYASESAVFRKRPDTKIQNVNLVEYHEVRVEDVVARLGLHCKRKGDG